MKHVNIRFPDDLHEAATAAANADRRPLGPWIRIAVEEKLARDKDPRSQQSLATRLDGRPLLREVSPNFKKGGKK